jgi:hypothetical protein
VITLSQIGGCVSMSKCREVSSLTAVSLLHLNCTWSVLDLNADGIGLPPRTTLPRSARYWRHRPHWAAPTPWVYGKMRARSVKSSIPTTKVGESAVARGKRVDSADSRFFSPKPRWPTALNSTVFFIYVIVITHIIRFVSFSRLYEMRKLCTLSCASKDLAMRTLSSYLSLNFMPIDYQTGNRS